jgi:site-specific recombinase XerD
MNRENAKTGGSEPGAQVGNGQGSHPSGNPAVEGASLTALVSHGGHYQLALRNAVQLWAEANTAGTSNSREDLIQAKITAVLSFFRFSESELSEVTSMDVRNWRESMEVRGHKPATVYARVSRLSSFFEWLIRNPVLSSYIRSNPVSAARPKAPRAYQNGSAKALNDKQLTALLRTMKQKAESGDVVAKRDYAILLFFVMTGLRRNEVIGLKGKDLEFKDDRFLARCKVKGGDFVWREIGSAQVKEALLEYLESCERTKVLKSGRSIWTRHDHSGRSGGPLSSHSFAKNLKKYAAESGLESIHIHQTRHTFARMVSEDTGSLVETQEALGHRNLATTRVYVQSIAVKKDKHSGRISERLGIS